VKSRNKELLGKPLKSAEMLAYDDAVIEASEGNDRTMAIMMGAFVENRLEYLLQFHLVNKLTSLFEYPNILATFDAKIDISFVIGIIGQTTYDNLKLIKKIRNTFAHSLLIHDDTSKLPSKLVRVSFRTKTITDWCHSLRLGKYDTTPDAKSLSRAHLTKDPRERYRLACLGFVAVMHSRMAAKPKPEACTPQLP
jgi:hypothetical protein